MNKRNIFEITPFNQMSGYNWDKRTSPQSAAQDVLDIILDKISDANKVNMEPVTSSSFILKDDASASKCY